MSAHPMTLATLAQQALEAVTACHGTATVPETHADPDANAPRRLWMVKHPEGWASHSFTPPVTLPEVRGWYPGAEIQPEDEPNLDPLAEPDPVAPAPGAARCLVTCSSCAHWRADPIGDGGLGSCQAKAPASLRPGACWPGSQLRCREHREIAP
jgi:hypothetical protein